jgi:hypothetical protein
MRRKGILFHKLIRNARSEFVFKTPLHVDSGKFSPLEFKIFAELVAFARQVGTFGIRLGADGNILASGHRHGAPRKAGDSRN